MYSVFGCLIGLTGYTTTINTWVLQKKSEHLFVYYLFHYITLQMTICLKKKNVYGKK